MSDAEGRLREARAAFVAAGAREGSLGAILHQGWLLLEDDRLEECDRHLATAGADVAAAGSEQTAAVVDLLRAHAACWRGRLAEARDFLAAAPGPQGHDAWQVADEPASSGWHVPGSGQGTLPPPSTPLLARVVRGRLCAVERSAHPAVAVPTPGRPFATAIDVVTMHEAAVLELAARSEWDRADDELDRGLAAARAAHAPLAALALRLTAAECAARYGAHATSACHADAAALRAWEQAALPGLLRRRVRALHEISRSRAVAVAGPDGLDSRSAPAMVMRFLHVANGAGDESSAVAQASEQARRLMGAAAVTVFGYDGRGGVAALVQVGGRPCDAGLARRAAQTGLAAGTDEADPPRQLSVPVNYARSCVGVVGARWCGTGGMSSDAGAILEALASACAGSIAALISRMASDTPAGGAADQIVGSSRAARDLRALVLKVAGTPFPVLIEGESGTGKELAARAIHLASARRARRWCAVNCAAITDELIEAELFGYVKGAFTGAMGDRPGLFEEADGGTLLLDEVGELSARAQAKLLRAIQEGEIRRLGENGHRRVDVRIVAATNRSLADECASGRFRRDLLYRLDVVRIEVPPLRDRPEDIPLLVERFWKTTSAQVGSRAMLSPEAVAVLAAHQWPGNVRELQNTLTALAAQGPRLGRIGVRDLRGVLARHASPDFAGSMTLGEARRRFEERFVAAALARAGGHRCRAAADLGVTRQGLAKLLTRLGMEGPTAKGEE